MRNLVITLLAVVIAATGMYSLVRADVFVRTCQTPISYRVGDIDDEFRIGSSSVRGLLTDAVSVWERNTDKDLFNYSTSSPELIVNFAYDQRQERTQTRNEINENLSSLAESHDSLTASIDQKRQAYESARQTYEQIRQRYERSLDEFNERVNRWNNENVVPSDVRESLAAERDRLNDVRTSLEEIQVRLEQLRTDINQLAARSNKIAETYNQTANTFAERFGGGRKFNQATYSDNNITVYQFNERSDLRLALTHELGHALGIRHVTNPQSVMYELMKNQPLANITLTAEDKQALTNVCGR